MRRYYICVDLGQIAAPKKKGKTLGSEGLPLDGVCAQQEDGDTNPGKSFPIGGATSYTEVYLSETMIHSEKSADDEITRKIGEGA